jgi:hypothetical protein
VSGGAAIESERFDQVDYDRFTERLGDSLAALAGLLERPGFGRGPATLGMELELFLVDRCGRPLPRNQAVCRTAGDPLVGPELDRFNLELTTAPVPLAGRPFSRLGQQLADRLELLARTAGSFGGSVVTVGILPTLRATELQAAALTDAPRYRALAQRMAQLRGQPMQLRIRGREPLAIDSYELALAGAGTALQVHLRVDPGQFARTYNAVQLATPVVLAAAGNSPILLGHLLWEETRVPLMEQTAQDAADGRHRRAGFGSGWVDHGPLELFERAVREHQPLLPVLGSEDPLWVVRDGAVPLLHELRLHQGTVWDWNRAVYDPAAGGHLRIELRALPPGPTVQDALANAAFLVGLALALAPAADRWTQMVPFGGVRQGFYLAARDGLAAELCWPQRPGGPARAVPAAQLARRLLPVAHGGLVQAGVAEGEAGRLLEAVAARVGTGQTGAVWQRRGLLALRRQCGPQRAPEVLLARYLELAGTGRPVHRWPPATPATTAASGTRRQSRVADAMAGGARGGNGSKSPRWSDRTALAGRGGPA